MERLRLADDPLDLRLLLRPTEEPEERLLLRLRFTELPLERLLLRLRFTELPLERLLLRVLPTEPLLLLEDRDRFTVPLLVLRLLELRPTLLRVLVPRLLTALLEVDLFRLPVLLLILDALAFERIADRLLEISGRERLTAERRDEARPVLLGLNVRLVTA